MDRPPAGLARAVRLQAHVKRQLVVGGACREASQVLAEKEPLVVVLRLHGEPSIIRNSAGKM